MTIPELAAAQRRFFNSGRTRSVAFREEQLRRLQAGLRAEEKTLLAALKQDLNKSAGEAYMTELGIVYDELSFALKHLRRWAKPKGVRLPLFQFPASGCILPEPYGTALLIAPWNYPVQLTLNPLIAALAAATAQWSSPPPTRLPFRRLWLSCCPTSFPPRMWRWWKGDGRRTPSCLSRNGIPSFSPVAWRWGGRLCRPLLVI